MIQQTKDLNLSGSIHKCERILILFLAFVTQCRPWKKSYYCHTRGFPRNHFLPWAPSLAMELLAVLVCQPSLAQLFLAAVILSSYCLWLGSLSIRNGEGWSHPCSCSPIGVCLVEFDYEMTSNGTLTHVNIVLKFVIINVNINSCLQFVLTYKWCNNTL